MGAPDVKVVNVTKESVWARDAVLPSLGRMTRPSPDQLMVAFGLDEVPDELTFPLPRMPREAQQQEYLREIEIDPAEYYPPSVARDLITEWPADFTIKTRQMTGGDDGD